MSTEKFIAFVKRHRAVPEHSSLPYGVRVPSAEGFISRASGLTLHAPDLDHETLDSLISDVAECERAVATASPVDTPTK